ncbi:MAG: hypothetical protein AAGJ97_03265, partial [Planctomycetota bacterium]
HRTDSGVQSPLNFWEPQAVAESRVDCFRAKYETGAAWRGRAGIARFNDKSLMYFDLNFASPAAAIATIRFNGRDQVADA